MEHGKRCGRRGSDVLHRNHKLIMMLLVEVQALWGEPLQEKGGRADCRCQCYVATCTCKLRMRRCIV